MTTYDWAKRYIEVGWSIFPVGNNKAPAVKEWIPYRSRYATDEELHEWFDKGNNGIAVATGKLSGIIVVDDDSVKAGGVPVELIQKMHSTVEQTTAHGGKHFFLKYEEGYGNRINVAGGHFDIKSEGGYVVIPPTTLVENGEKHEYAWVEGKTPTPEHLAGMGKLSFDSDVEKAMKRVGNAPPLNPNDYMFLAKGQRDDGLFRLARSWLNKNPKEWVYDTILNIGKNYDPPLSESQIQKIFKQAVHYFEMDKPAESLDVQQMPRDINDVVVEREKELEFERVAPSTGFYELDKLIIGLIPTSLYTLTGETNAGKTTFACNLAVNVANQGKKVLYIALETGNKIVEVLASARLNKPYNELMPKDMKDDRNLIRLFVDRDIKSVKDLKERLEMLEERYDLIIIDNIGYFVTDKENYLREQANILKELRFITKEKKMAIIVIAHLRKRGKDTKANAVPTSDDISGSASFKQDSTDVLIVIRQKDEMDEHKLKLTNTGYLYVTKTKGRSVGAVKLRFHDTDMFAKSAKIEEIL